MDSNLVPSNSRVRNLVPAISINVTNREGHSSTLIAKTGVPLAEILSEQSDVEAVCGGVASCGTCHVYIDDGHFAQLPNPGSEEAMLLEGLMDTQQSSRLACQITLTSEMDQMSVRIAPEI